MNTEKICNACGCVIEEEAVEIDGLFYCPECMEDESLWGECVACGKKIFLDNVEYQAEDGAVFCSEECVADAGYFICAYCEEIHNKDEIEPIAIDEFTYCSEECAHDDGLEKCSDCGEWYSSYDVEFVESIGACVCDECLRYSGNYFKCDCCEEWYGNNDLWQEDDRIAICDNCSRHYYVCADCDCIVYEDDVYWVDDDCPHCESCYYDNHNHDDDDDEGGDINSWNYRPSFRFYPDMTPVVGQLYMGVEREVDGGNGPRELASELVDYREIYCKHDGSLNCGVEIISHPCTLDYHTNKLPWEEIENLALGRNFKSHDTSTCGLHVHVNRSFFGDNRDEQDLNIAKVILIVNRFWDSHIVPFTRRQTSNINQWAKKNEVGTIYDGDAVAAKRRKTIDGSSRMGRYVAVNLQNYETIEFRIFRGTLKHSTFIATLQFVDTLCRFVKSISIDDVDNLTWEDIFAGTGYPELNAYLAERTDFNPTSVKKVFIERKLATINPKNYTPIKDRHNVAVGDRVIIRSWENMCSEYEYNSIAIITGRYPFVDGMKHLCGRTATVIRVTGSVLGLDFDDKSGDICWNFTAEMIDVIAKRDRNDVQVGDRVIFRNWDDMAAEFGVCDGFIATPMVVSPEMMGFCGKKATVTDIDRGYSNTYISLEFDDQSISQDFYSITTDMIELLS